MNGRIGIMKCPSCHSTELRKNGRRYNKQCFQCKHCGRQFVDERTPVGYHPEVKKLCIKMYLNGMGFRGIERVTGIHHTTIIHWVKEVGIQVIEESEDGNESPNFAQLDELQTFVGKKSQKIWVWTALNSFKSGILDFRVGDRSGKTFQLLWSRVEKWSSLAYMTDGYAVYPNFIPPEKHKVVKKTRMTRVEGENTRLRHYLARLHRSTLCYSKSLEMLEHSVRLLIYYLRFRDVPTFA